MPIEFQEKVENVTPFCIPGIPLQLIPFDYVQVGRTASLQSGTCTPDLEAVCVTARLCAPRRFDLRRCALLSRLMLALSTGAAGVS